MENQLPHRYRETQFRRYELYIHHAVEAYPQAIKCDPKLFNVANETFRARLGDAIKSLYDNQWKTTIDVAKFRAVYASLQVSMRVDGTILVGTREAIQQWSKQDTIPTIEAAPTNNLTKPIIVTSATSEFLMQLSHNRLLSPRLKVIGLTSADVEFYQQKYDIALDENTDGTYTLL